MKNNYCKWCNFRHEDDGSKCVFDADYTGQFHCVLDPTMSQILDAAEFEARVVSKLANRIFQAFDEGFFAGYYGSVLDSTTPNTIEELKIARLAVEEEMDR